MASRQEQDAVVRESQPVPVATITTGDLCHCNRVRKKAVTVEILDTIAMREPRHCNRVLATYWLLGWGSLRVHNHVHATS